MAQSVAQTPEVAYHFFVAYRFEEIARRARAGGPA
jgi:hypothetical protein